MTTGSTGTIGTALRIGATSDEPGRSARPSTRTMVRRLLMTGCTPLQASNLAALAVGLGPVVSGWSILEIERLRFLQHLHANGRLPA